MNEQNDIARLRLHRSPPRAADRSRSRRDCVARRRNTKRDPRRLIAIYSGGGGTLETMRYAERKHRKLIRYRMKRKLNS